MRHAKPTKKITVTELHEIDDDTRGCVAIIT